jgi:hypothetical protein
MRITDLRLEIDLYIDVGLLKVEGTVAARLACTVVVVGFYAECIRDRYLVYRPKCNRVSTHFLNGFNGVSTRSEEGVEFETGA